jgi:tetratricopeptide (TPR) repeat protein
MFIQQALLYFRIGEFDRAQILYQESIKILRPIGDQALLADALIFGGIILHLSGEYARAKLLIEEGLAIARESHEQWFEAYAICNLGYISSIMGHYKEGYEQMLAALKIFRSLGDPHYIALVMNFMVPTLINLGKCREAKAFMQESIVLCEQSKNRWGLGTAYCYMGSAFTAEGEFKQAKTYLLQSLEIFGDFTKGWSVARSLIYLGDAALGSGDLKSARKNYQEALRLSVEEGAIPLALDTLLGLAELNARDGKEGDALVLCHTIINHPYSEDQTCARAKDLLASLEAHLDLKEIDAIFDAAKDKTLDTIIKETMSAA